VKQQLRQLLSRRRKRRIVDTSRISAAVLLPIYCNQGQYCLLLTKRTQKVKEHKGQISFPGGAYQEEDGILVNTVLRECAEEIGLMAEDIEILGELDDSISRTSNYIISPFVAFIPWPYQFKVNGEETEEIIEIPVLALLDKDGWHPETEIIDGESVIAYSYHYQGIRIWGATARILNQFLDIFVLAQDR
jgi:8-oxo-dGTP pyrophosphatase MutT (NUDIX family)